MDEIPKGDVAGQQDDGDENNDGGVDEFLVLLKSANFRIGFPRPGCLAELGFNFTDEFEDFLEHLNVWGN